MTTSNQAAAQPAQDAQLTPQQAWDQEVKRRANGETGPSTEETAPPIDGSAAAPGEATESQEAVELPEELKAALAQVSSMKGLVDRLQHQVDSSNGRLGALQRELNAAKSAATVTTGAAPNQQTIAKAAKSPEKWQTLKNEFPEWGEAVEALVTANLGDQPQAVDLTPLQQQLQQGFEILQGLQERVKFGLVFAAHRDWKTVTAGKAWADWYAKQSPEVQQMTFSDNPEEAIACLDLFKAQRTQSHDATRDVGAERHARLAAAAQTPRRGSAPPPKSDAEKSAGEIWNEEASAGAAKRKAAGY